MFLMWLCNNDFLLVFICIMYIVMVYTAIAFLLVLDQASNLVIKKRKIAIQSVYSSLPDLCETICKYNSKS